MKSTWVQEVRHPTNMWFSTYQLLPSLEMSYDDWALIAVKHVHQANMFQGLQHHIPAL